MDSDTAVIILHKKREKKNAREKGRPAVMGGGG